MIKQGKMKTEEMADKMKKMGKLWGELPEKEKEMFNQASRQDKERYDKEMQEFEIQGGKGKNIQDYDAQRPKKCLSAYMIFVRETRPKVVKELKNKSNPEDGKNSQEEFN